MDYAIENSLAVRQATLGAEQAEINKRAAEMSRLPNISGSTGFNQSFGRRIDPTTNDFINQRFGNQNLSVSGGILLYNGSRLSNQIRQARLQGSAAALDVDQMKNDLALDVATVYLQILFAGENYSNAQKNLDLINSQLDQMNKLIEAGSRPQNARLDIVARVAQNEQLVVTAQNDIDLAYLNLKQLLQLDEDFDLEIEVPDILVPAEDEIESGSAQQVYNQALEWQPSIKAGDMRRKAAELGVQVAQANLLPSLSIGGSLGTNWSSSFRNTELVGTQILNEEAFINGEPVQFGLRAPITEVLNVPYVEQLNQNLGYGFGVSLQVPIFAQGRNRANVDLARLDVVRSEIDNEQIKNQLKTDVQQAVAAAQAARKQYEAATRTAEAMRAAYNDTEKRYGLGVANNFEFITAQNNQDRAEVDLLIAKYDYIFKAKVLDFYRGRRITLK